MWTMWREAPVTADAAITSPIDSMLEPGSRRPELRTCTKTGPRMAGRRTEVDRRLAPPRVEERRDVGRADLELERGGDPFLRREAIGRGIVDMGMEIDETGRDHQPARIDDRGAGERLLGHRRDPPTGDPDVPHRIEARFWIDDAPAPDYQVERGRLRLERQSARGHDQCRRHGRSHAE